MRRTTRTIPRRFVGLIAGLALAGSTAVALARAPVRVLTDDLRLQAADLVEIDGASVLLRGPDGRSFRVVLDTVLAIGAKSAATGGLPDLPLAVMANASTGAERLFVELTDSQRIVLDILPGDDPEVLTGTALGLGPARIPLERVTRIARAGAPWRATVPTEDLVLLLNGDRLSGFVLGVGGVGRAVGVEIETASGAIASVPLDRVAEIRLANPPAAPDARTLFVTDDLGITLAASTLTAIGSGEFRLTTSPVGLGVDSGGEEAITYERPRARLLGLRSIGGSLTGGPSGGSSGRSVLALGTVSPASVTPTGDRRWTPPPEAPGDTSPVMALGDVTMPAPAEAVYFLGRGVNASRVACTVRAMAPGAWTDCVARVEAELADGARVVLGEHRLTQENPGAEINAELPAGTRAIVLVVDPGRYGAVQDGVVFASPRVLLAD